MFSILKSWIRNEKKPAQAGKPHPRFRPGLESLDERLVPSTLTVTSPADNGAAGTLRYEFNLANKDAAKGVSDTIAVAQSLKGATITLNRPLEATPAANNARVWLEGNYVTISGGGKTNMLLVDRGAAVSLHHLTMSQGTARAGGAINNSGSVSMGNVMITFNSAMYGGGVYNDGTFTFADSSISGDNATWGGGVYNESNRFMSASGSIYNQDHATWGGAVLNFGKFYDYNTTYSYDAATNTGGGIYNAGYAFLNACTFDHDRSGLCGGGVFDQGNVTITNSTFSYNRADHYGGGVYVSNTGTYSTQNNHYSHNTAVYGNGDFYVYRT